MCKVGYDMWILCLLSYAFESYPISVATYGYSFNATCSAVAGVVIPFIIEYIKEKYVFLIYAIEGVVCTFLFFFLKETRGKEREDNIKEIEEESKKESGKANDHELGRLNDIGMKLGGLAIAGYLFTKKQTPLTKVMEFVGDQKQILIFLMMMEMKLMKMTKNILN